jgi:hypothetical protein
MSATAPRQSRQRYLNESTALLNAAARIPALQGGWYVRRRDQSSREPGLTPL